MAYAATPQSTLSAASLDILVEDRQSLLFSSFSSYSEELRQLIQSAADWIGVQSKFVPLTDLDRDAMLMHFKALSSDDLRLRFGTNISESFLSRYVSSLNFERDCVIGMYEGTKLLALCQLALYDQGSSKMGEVGLSILNEYRGRGYASDMMVACFAEAAKADVEAVYINYAHSNKAMAALCSKFNATLRYDGSDVIATMQVQDAKGQVVDSPGTLIEEPFTAELSAAEAPIQGLFNRLFGKISAFLSPST